MVGLVRLSGLSLVGLVVSLAIVGFQEFAVRFALPAYDPATRLEFEKRRGDLPSLGPRGEIRRQISNAGDYDVFIRFNRHGLRDANDVAGAGPEDLFVVGDSFPFGWGVEETERFPNRLAEITGRKVYTVATPEDFDGYERLVDYAISLGAPVRHLVIAVNMSGDLAVYRDADERSEPAEDTPPLPTDFKGRLNEVKTWLKRNSALYFAVSGTVHRVPWLERAAQAVGLVTPIDRIAKRDWDPAIVPSSAERLAILARRFDTTVVIIPHTAVWVGDDRENATAIHDAFVVALRTKGMRTIDLKPVLEKGGDPMALHFKHDGHWTAQGHGLAARTIAAALAEKDRAASR